MGGASRLLSLAQPAKLGICSYQGPLPKGSSDSNLKALGPKTIPDKVFEAMLGLSIREGSGSDGIVGGGGGGV